MPNINLISARRAEKKKIEQWTRQLFYGLVGSVGAFILLGSYLGIQRLAMENERREAEEALLRLKPKLDRIAQINADKESLLPKVATLQQARADTLRWRAVLQVVSQSVPYDTWLTAINATGAGESTVLRLVGSASSQSLVGDMMLRLNQHPLFTKVDLTFTTAVQSLTGTAPSRFNFEVAAQLRGTVTTPVSKPKEGEKSIDAGKRQDAVNKVSQNDSDTTAGQGGMNG
jgi:Tfp pilus assembly protein PilN